MNINHSDNTSGYEFIKDKSNTLASVLEDVSILIGKRIDESINLKTGENFKEPGINLGDEAQELANLAEDIRKGIFKLIVLGVFSNGKSTLINALLGEEILKAKALPTTSIVTMLVHGDSPDVVIHYKDDKAKSRMDYDSFFKEFTLTINDRENIKNIGHKNRFKDIKYAQIERNCRLLNNGVRLIDSPGLEDEKSRTDLVITYLNECQAVIFVLDAQGLLQQSEKEFIEEELGDVNFNNIFFVVNKINLVEQSEVEEIKEFLRKSIQHHFLDDNGVFDASRYQRRVFFVNALGALKVRTGEYDYLLLEESGIPELENELERFLTSDAKNTAVFETTFQRLSDVIIEAHKSINTLKDASDRTLQELEANRIEAEKRLDDLEKRKEEIEEIILRFGNIVSEKIFSSLILYLSDLKAAWEIDSKNFELKGLNIGEIIKSVASKKAREKIKNIVKKEIEQYLKDKFKQWGKNKVPTIIKEDIDDMMEIVESQVEDFQLELIQVDKLFTTGEILSSHELDTEKGKVSKTVQAFMNLWMLDFSGFAATLMGRGDWVSFITRVVIDLLLYGVFAITLGPIFGIIGYVIAELLHVGIQEFTFKERLLKSVGEKLHENLPTEMSKQHDKICGEVQQQFKQKAEKLTETLQAQIKEKRIEQEDIINRKRQEGFSIDKEKSRLDNIDSKLIEFLNVAGVVIGKSSEEIAQIYSQDLT